MRIVLKLVCTSLIAVFLFAIGVSAFSYGKNKFVYLILGLDDAASNSDSIMLVSYDSSDNSASVIQLPRDTYCKSGSDTGKINGVYATFKASGLSDKESARRTTDFISGKLGIRIDGFCALRLADLIKLVDALGGVHIILPREIAFYDGQGRVVRTLNAGENILSGEDSAFFVRYRAGYKTGDIGRLDAQKIFIDALFKTAVRNVGIDELFDIAGIFSKSVATNIGIRDVLGLVLKHSSKFRETEITYLTMPGAPLRAENGSWYYVINRKDSITVLKNHLFSSGDQFDKSEDFLNKNESSFSKIYFSETITHKEYRSFDEIGSE